MTTVTFEPYYDTYMFRCSGHSGYSAPGHDIVCSAVSVLCYTLDDFLSRSELEGRISSYKRDFSDGYVSIDFEAVRIEDTGLFDGIEAILGGFRLLSEHFPEYVAAEF